LFDPLGKETKVQLGLKGNTKGLNYGFLHSMGKASGGAIDFVNEKTSFMASHKNAEGTEAGTEVAFNHGTGKMDMRLALKLVQHDHLLGLQLANSGLAKMFVKWDAHHLCNHSCQAQVGTEVHLCDLAKGSLTSLPISFKMEMKY